MKLPLDLEQWDRADPERVACMSFFEAALMHARLLNDFLTARPGKRFPDDVWAGDYITGWTAPDPGPLQRAQCFGSNRAIKDAIDKQLAHLSIRRVRGQEDIDVAVIVDAIVQDMKTFAKDETNVCYEDLNGVRELLHREPWSTDVFSM